MFIQTLPAATNIPQQYTWFWNSSIGYKGPSNGISVRTKMLHIEAWKAVSESLFGETLNSHNNPWEIRRHVKLGSSQIWRHCCVPSCQRLIVIGSCFLQPMPPQKSYTSLQKNLIFLISFPWWVQVCNISTKPVAPFFGLNTEEVTESPVLFCVPAANSDIQDCKKSKRTPLKRLRKCTRDVL